MRLTGQFAVTGALIGALAALPLARLWAVAGAFGDAHSQALAEWLAIGGAVLLLLLFMLLRWQLLRPLAGATAVLRGEGSGAFEPAGPVPATWLRDLSALTHAVPGMRRSQGNIDALEQAVARAREQFEEQGAAFEARSRYLRSLAEAVALPIALHDPSGHEVFANEAWHARAPDAEAPPAREIAEGSGRVVGVLLCDAAPAREPAGALEDRVATIAAAVRRVGETSLTRTQRSVVARMALATAELEALQGPPP